MVWQKMMIALARNQFLNRTMQEWPAMSLFSKRFVGGIDRESGIERCLELAKQGTAASLFFLGEYVEDQTVASANISILNALVPRLAKAGLDLHISVDPTQAGAMTSWSLCRDNVVSLAKTIQAHSAAGHDVVMLDMEDASVTQQTIDLYYHLRSLNLPAAITIQTYLHRTQHDLAGLIGTGAMVRLVKGAFAEKSAIAVTGRHDRDQAFRKGIDALFSGDAKARGVRPVLGTHDHAMIEYASQAAEANGWGKTEWEVEMLLGVRPDYQAKLMEQGYGLRLYVPFGRDWWPYSIRRVGENPRNALFLLRSLLS
jgi:proline dehydrogenase